MQASKYSYRKEVDLSKKMYLQSEAKIEEMVNILYAQAVSSLMYAMTTTGPNICYAVDLVSRYQSKIGKDHWQIVKRIFKYLQSTRNLGLCFCNSDLETIRYTNAHYAGDYDDRKSTNGYHVFIFGGTIISWLSKKQSCVAKSTMKVEYISCSTMLSNAV